MSSPIRDGRRGLLDRYPFDSPWIRELITRYGLGLWFAAHSAAAAGVVLRDPSYWFFDARLYLMATRVWLGGGNPWDVQLAGNYFAAPPISMLPLAPLTILPTDVAVGLLAALVIAGCLATISLLRLPWWWVLFPPLIQTMVSANVHGLLIPLILLRAGPLAGLLKAYAVPTLLIMGRWRALIITAAVVAITAPFLPWSIYLEDAGLIAARLADQTKHHIPVGILIAISPAVALALVLVGRERAAWMAVLALWPSQQYYYGTLVLPARSQVAAAVIALPITGSGILALGILAAGEWRRGVRPAWRLPRGTRSGTGPSAR